MQFFSTTPLYNNNNNNYMDHYDVSSSSSNVIFDTDFDLFSLAGATPFRNMTRSEKVQAVLGYFSYGADIASFAATSIYLIYFLARTLYTVPWSACPPVRRLKKSLSSCFNAVLLGRGGGGGRRGGHHAHTTTNNSAVTQSFLNNDTTSGGGDIGGGDDRQIVGIVNDNTNSDTYKNGVNFQLTAASADVDQVTWHNFYTRTLAECYLLSRPVARIILALISTQFLSTLPSMFNKYYSEHHIKAPVSFCKYQAFSVQFFGLATHLWCMMVAVWMFWILVLQRRSNLRNLEMFSHIIVWGMSAICYTIPLGMDMYGDTGGYCWIKSENKGRFLRFGIFYIPLWICVLVVVVLYSITIGNIIRMQIIMLRHSSKQKRMKHISTSMKLYIKLLVLPIVYIMCWTFPTIRRVAELKATFQAPFWLRFMHGISSSPHGFYNTLVFFLSEVIGSFFDRRARRRSEHQICDVHLQESTNDYIRWMQEGVTEGTTDEDDEEDGDGAYEDGGSFSSSSSNNNSDNSQQVRRTRRELC